MAEAYAASSPAQQGNSKTEPPKKSSQPNPAVERYWREIDRYQQAAGPWQEECKKYEKLYLDHGKRAESARRFAIFWANVETLKPAIYAKTPVMNVSRRHKDPDPIGRICAELMERCANTTFDLYNVDCAFRCMRDDRLIAARGQTWVRYEADIEQEPGQKPAANDNDAVGEDEEPVHEYLAGEKVCVDHVHWLDFGHNVARTWPEVWLVWRAVYWSRDQAVDRLGKDKAKLLSYDHKPTSLASDDETSEGTKQAELQARVLEVWDKKRRRMALMSKGCPDFLEIGPPPLNLHNFFPCAEPAYGSKTSSTLIPTPDYRYYRDQAQEIDDLTDKIGQMTQWLIVKGFIPGGPSQEGTDAVKQLIEKSGKQLFAEVESWQAFVDKGGAKSLIEWFPIEAVVAALKAAIEAREQLIQDVYQITGVSDILRGQTDPNETLGAQELKAQTGSRRVRNTKDEIARHCRDTGRIVCEVIAEQFSPETIAAMSGYKYMPAMPQEIEANMQQQTAQGAEMPLVFDDRVMQRLRDDRMRSYTVDVETDSTVQPDEDSEKQRRVEFLTAFGGFLQQATGLFQLGPMAAPLAPMIAEGLKFAVRGFRAGRQMEDTIERSLDQMVKQVNQAAQQPPPPDPKMLAVQQKAETDKATLQLKAQGQQQEGALKVRQQDMDFALETRRQGFDQQHQAQQQQFDQGQASQQQQFDQAGAEADRQMSQQNAEADRAMAQQNAEADRELTAQEMPAQPQGAGEAPAAAQSDPMAMLRDISQAVQMLLQAQLGPRRVIRDASGRAVGLETPLGVQPIERDAQGRLISTGPVQAMQ